MSNNEIKSRIKNTCTLLALAMFVVVSIAWADCPYAGQSASGSTLSDCEGNPIGQVPQGCTYENTCPAGTTEFTGPGEDCDTPLCRICCGQTQPATGPISDPAISDGRPIDPCVVQNFCEQPVSTGKLCYNAEQQYIVSLNGVCENNCPDGSKPITREEAEKLRPKLCGKSGGMEQSGNMF